MRKIKQILHSPYVDYFFWLVFLLDIVVLQIAIRNLHIFREFHVLWIDIVASYFLYIDMSIPLVLPVLILFAIFGIIWQKTGHNNQQQICKTVIIALTAVVWTILFCFITFSLITIFWENRNQIPIIGDIIIRFREYLLKDLHLNNKLIGIRELIFNKIPIIGIAIIIICSLLGIKVFLKNKVNIFAWYTETTQRIKVFVLLLIFCSFIFIPYLCIHPHNNKNTNRFNTEKQQGPYPNIFFIVIDALTAEDMSLYGYSLPTTPMLERETENWSIFSNAHSTGNSTLSFFPSIITGRYPYIYRWYQYGKLTRSDDGWFDLTSFLRELGYTIYWNGCYSPRLYHLNRSIHNFGTMNWYLSFFNKITYAYFFPLPYVFDFHFNGPTEEEFGQETKVQFSHFLSYLRNGKIKNQPLFAYLHVLGVHGFPYPSGEDFGLFLSKQHGGDKESEKGVYGLYAPEKQKEVDKLHLRYDEAIVNIDKQICSFIDSLKEVDLYNNSIIMITADHGENFSSGYSSHSTPLLSFAEHHIPLLIKFPFQEKGERNNQIVSVVDIAPTILEYLKVKIPISVVDGHSLKSVIQEKGSNRIVYTLLPYDWNNWSNGKPTNAAIWKDYKIISRQGKMFLFDIAQDPTESINLYKTKNIPQLEHALEVFAQRKRAIEKGLPVKNAPQLIEYIETAKSK